MASTTEAVAEAQTGRVENEEYAAMMDRMLGAWLRRLADADEYDLSEFVAWTLEVDRALAAIVSAWREAGRSWTEVGRALGISRQAAQQRFGHRLTHSG